MKKSSIVVFFIVFIFCTCLFSGDVKSIKSEAEFNALIGGDKPVLADFFATWCPPCKALKPILDEVAKDMGKKAVVVKIDVDKNKDLAAKYGVSSIPDVRIFYKGKIVDKLIGLRKKKDYIASLEKHIK